MAKTQESRQFI